MKAFNNEADLFFSNKKTGYGQYAIVCEVKYCNLTKSFEIHTTDCVWIDELNDMISDQVSFENIQQKYYDRFEEQFEEKIVNWMYEIDNQ